jgi:hypothetical protein
MRPPHHILDRTKAHRLAVEHLQAHLKFQDGGNPVSVQFSGETRCQFSFRWAAWGNPGGETRCQFSFRWAAWGGNPVSVQFSVGGLGKPGGETRETRGETRCQFSFRWAAWGQIL